MPTLAIDAHEDTLHTRRLTQFLIARYAGRHTADHVTRVVADANDAFATARIRTFVPILAERVARDALGPPPRR
jgi:hypothetical protein